MLTISKGVSKHSMLWFLLTDSRRECGSADCTSSHGVPGVTEVEIHWGGHARLNIASGIITLEEIVESVVRRASGTVSLRSVDQLYLQEFLAARIVVRRGVRVLDSVNIAVVCAEIVVLKRLGWEFVQAVI